MPLSDQQIENIRSLKSKRLTFVICGQNVLAKAIVANELLMKQLLPFQIENYLNEKWRIVKIKVSNLKKLKIKINIFSLKVWQSTKLLISTNRF